MLEALYRVAAVFDDKNDGLNLRTHHCRKRLNGHLAADEYISHVRRLFKGKGAYRLPSPRKRIVWGALSPSSSRRAKVAPCVAPIFKEQVFSNN